MGRLNDVTAVVTGGGNGLGRAFCEELGRRGCRVAIGDIDVETARSTVDLVNSVGGEAEAFECDVREPTQVEELKAAAEDRFGVVDLLVNNAGVAVGGTIGEVSLEDWKWVVDINLWGVIYGCHVFAPDMKRRRRGHIINVASAAGLISTPQLGPYNVTKSGVVALSETLHVEAREFDVNVSVLCPTFFKTKIMESSRGVQDPVAQAAALKLMEKSKLQAPDVAREALKAVEDGKLYCVPMEDGRRFWRLKRMWPERFADLVSQINKSERLQGLLGMKKPKDDR